MTASGHAPGAAVVGAVLATTILAALVTIFRLFTRICIVRRPGIDDVCITVAATLSIALAVCMCQQVKYGMGRHESTLSDYDKKQSTIWFWASVWIYYLALCLTKLSILLQYLRVFPHNKFRIACYTLMGVVIVYSLGTFFSAIFACVPIARFWDSSIPGTCVNRVAVWFANASINIVTDLCTAVLPLPVLNTLQLPKRQKRVLMGVFALGGFTCIISILRLQSLYVVSHSTDISWDNPLAAIWSCSELNVGIICSCIPTLKGCVVRVFPALFSSTAMYGDHSGSHELGNSAHVSSLGQSRRSKHDSAFTANQARSPNGWEPPTPHSYVYIAGEKRASPLSPNFPRGNSGRVEDIKVQTIVEQEVERPDEEISPNDSDSIRPLVPAPVYRPELDETWPGNIDYRRHWQSSRPQRN